MTSLSLVLYNTVSFAHPEEVPPLPPLTFSCLQNLMALHQLYSRHVVSIFHSVQLYLHTCTDTGDPPSSPPPLSHLMALIHIHHAGCVALLACTRVTPSSLVDILQHGALTVF